ncbi:MAG: efflux RND transporter permease subunit, partial [Campylobacterales bacterium]|nr:efflux RND transporter permease subunit [Campylobacterales bacterium]
MYKFAIDRPITVLMGVLAFIIFGLMSYKTMPVNLFPNVDFPIITVQTVYHGADPETVESKVTDKIEEAVSGVDGIDKLTSTSSEGISVVVIQFELTKDIDEAANDVRDKVNGIIFPNDVNKPLVKKVAAAGGSVINLYVASKTGDDISLMRLADEKLKPRLQRVEGVGEISIVGFRDREIRVFPDPFLLNKYGITLTELQGLLARDNVRAGGGKLIGSSSELVLKARGDAKTLEEIQNLKILPGVRLKDIAEVKDSLSDAKSFSSLNGNPGIMLEIKKISGKNTLDIINGVKAAMPDIEKMAGKDYELQLLRDQSGKILANMDNVTFDLIFGSILAIIIVFVFLRNGTATMVSALAIPTSVIGTFAVIDLLGYDLNRLTMIGLTLAIGIFIDDAIVVIENIAKKMEHGMKPFEASVEGVKEIVFSVLAIASMLLAVFIPVAFMDGIVGMFFNSFAMTVASGIVLSFFIATMLIPTVGA